MEKIKSILQLLRVEQWVKNIFCFLPIFFDQKLFNVDYVLPTVWCAVMFSLVSSVVYIINDWKDISYDRQHPIKCFRPLASGVVKPIEAGLVIVALAIVVSVIAITTNVSQLVCVIVAIYFVMQMLYTFWLKNVAIIDVSIIAIGFVLRVEEGGAAAGVEISQWIIVMTFLITLFMAFAKRRDDVVLMQNNGNKPRYNSDRYSLDFVNISLGVLSAITVVAYLLYCFTPEVVERYGTDKLYITSIFVLLGLLHYLQLAIVDNKSASPTKILLKDHFIQLMIVLFVLTFAVIIYVI